MVGKKTTGLLAAAAAASASVIDLPVHIQNTYVSPQNSNRNLNPKTDMTPQSSVEFQIGTPPKPYRLLFDTGSSTAWLTNSDCTASSCPNSSGFNRTLYSAAASSTSVDLGSAATIGYIDGDGVTGAALRDAFADENETVQWNQTFLSANTSSWRFITADGFLGLGFSSIAENATTSLVETLLWDGALDAPRFALFYGTDLRDAADGAAQDGVLTIGGSHEDKYVDADGVVYAALRKEDPYQLWRAPLRTLTVLATGTNETVVLRNDGKLPPTSSGGFINNNVGANASLGLYGNGRAVFDTGAGRIQVPRELVDTVYYNLGWNNSKLLSGEERFECEHLNASWALAFALGDGAVEDDVVVAIRGDEFVRPGDQCMPPVDDSGTDGFALIGATFLRRFYSVFDFGADKVEAYQPRIGFGRLKKEYDYLYQ
ncbi:putative pepsinogen c [Diplodia seriata]|uniref:Putative pepsinogen c n=1 Tax=Diplodia seriata TaxID=420778 RepID=A0A0G2E0S6_9PEZI|nr:putative pepsinogen c [Diplodia seriata]